MRTINCVEQEIDRQLHRCNIRITNFTSKIGSASVLGVVRELSKEENTSEELIKHIHGRITNKHKEKIVASLKGVVADSDRFILRHNYEELNFFSSASGMCKGYGTNMRQLVQGRNEIALYRSWHSKIECDDDNCGTGG